jgi:hypothetical protein
VSADEFEREHKAPLSPDERFWRHPTELADVERNKHFSHAPPLGRKLTAITATVSAVASIAILSVAIPKGIREFSEAEAEAVAVTTTVDIPHVKNALTTLVATATGTKGSTTAISIGSDAWVVAAEAVDIKKPLWLTLESGKEVQVPFFSTNEDATVILLRLTANQSPALAKKWDRYLNPTSPAELESFPIVDRYGVHHLGYEQSVRHQAKPKELPLLTDSPIDGAAAFIDKMMNVVGVAFDSRHSTWFLAKDSLLSLLAEAPQSAPR